MMANKKVKILDEPPAKMQSSKLPTNCDIIKAIFFIKESKKVTTDNAVKIIAKQLSEMWQRSAIPAVTESSVVRLVSKYFQKYNQLCRAHSDRDSTTKFHTFKVSKCLLKNLMKNR